MDQALMHGIPRFFSHSDKKRPPKLDLRLAKKNIDDEPFTSSSSDAASSPSSLRTRSLDISPLGNRTRFRIKGIVGEFDEVCSILGLSGPDDFSIPAAAWEARKSRSSLDPPRSRLHEIESQWRSDGVIIDGVRSDDVRSNLKMAAPVSNQKILNDDETVDGGLMAPCRRGESADSEISSDVSSDERFINKYVPPPRASFAISKENKDEGVCSFVDSMTSISSTDFDALDNRAHLGRAYHSSPIVFNSEKKDTREGLSGECLTKSALSFDDSTKRKSLPVDVNLSSFSEHASQDFDDFDFVGFDYGAGMLPNLMDEVLQTSHSSVGHLSTQLRLVRCPKCRQVFPEPANIPVYMCGGCNTVLQAKKHKNDQDKCSLKHNNGGDPNEYAKNGRNQSEFEDLKLDCSKNTKSSGEISSSTELTCQEIEESTPVIETNAQLDENSKSPMSLDQSQKRKLTGFDHVSSVDTLENIAIANYSSEFSVTHRDMPNFPTTSNYVYEGSVSSSDESYDQFPDPYLHLFKRKEKKAESPHAKAMHKRDEVRKKITSYPEMEREAWDCSSIASEKKHYTSKGKWHQDELMEPMRHGPPVRSKMRFESGGYPPRVPFYSRGSQVSYEKGSFSNYMREELQYRTSLHSPNKPEKNHEEEKMELLQRVIELQDQLNRTCDSLEDWTCLFPYADDYTPDAVAPPPSEVDDYGPSLGKSCSTEGEPFSAGLPFQALKRDSYGRKLSSGSSFEPMGDSVSSYDGNDDQVPDPYLHRLMELEQPATFAELGMDLDDNKGIIDNLLRFVRDKEIYKNAGKDWKRGYLLYNSPGTDRLSLIAAMANRLEFDIYDLDLMGLTSISELTNVLVSIRNHSLIAIKDFDHWAGKLPHFKTELTLSGLSKIIHGLLSSCGDEQIIVLTTYHNHNHIDGVDVALLRPLNMDLYIHTSSPQPKALPDGGEIVLLDSSEQKPSVDFDATNNRAYQSDVLVSNSEEKNTRVASRRQCMREGVPSLVDSMELEQPATFGELGMDQDNNKGIISDLLRFIRAKDIYKKAGKDWKRGYLLYDTPGTDRSSLIAAMANRLEFHIYHLDLTGFSSIFELRNVLVSIRNRSLIAIIDFDRWAGMLPNLKNELTPSSLSKIIHDLLSSCGDEQIIVLTINHNHIDGVDAFLLRSLYNDLYIHTPSPQPKALPDGGEIVLLDSSEQKPSEGFDATNNRAYQSDVLVSNSEEKNTREASRRQCMPEGIPSLVDSTTRISLMDFDALDNNAHLVRAYQSGPIVFNSEKKDTGEGFNRECLTKSALSLDDSTKPRSLPDFDATENKVLKVYTRRGRGCWDSMELEQRTTLEELGMDPENKGIISDLLRFVRDKEFYKKAGKDWKRGYLYDSLATDRSSLIAAMANFLEFDIYHLDLTGLTSISELTNVLVSIRNGSLIAIKDLDHWAGKLPDFKTELMLSSLLKIIHGLLSSCGDERIIVLTTNHNHIGSVDTALLRSLNIDLYIHTSSPQPKALPDGGEIVLLDPSEQKPSVDFDATNNKAYQSDVLVSDSEEKNTREASRRQCMPESVPSLVDSTTRISLTDFDAPDNSAHLVMAYQSGPIVFNSEKIDMGEVLSRECLTKSVLSLDDSSEQKLLSDVAVTGKKSHIVRAYESGPVVSFSDDKNGGEALKRECITKSILGLEDLQQHSGGRGDDAAKSFCAIYDPGIHTADSLARISFEVLENLPTREQPNDCVPLLSLGRLTLEDCVQQEKSPDLPRFTQINGVEQRVTKFPRYFGGLTAQSASSSRWPNGLPDGGHIVLLDPLDQSAKHIERATRADQCSPTLSLGEKKMVRNTLKRKCRTMSVIFEDSHQHFARRCEGDAKSLGVKRIKNQGIHQWPFFRQKWATRKGYSLGEERPFEVRRLSMDETLDSRLQLIHMSQFARSSPRALALPDGGEIVRPTALSSSEFAATNNRAHLVSQDQSGSTASHYKCKNSRETSDKQGLEDLQQHFGFEHKHALKSLGVSGSMFKSTCKQHWFYCWPGRFENNEQQVFDATSNRAHLVKADERGPTVSNALFLEDLRHQFGARCKDAAKGLHDSLARKSFKVQDNQEEQSNTRRRSLTHKHCVRLKKSQDLPRSMLRDCATGLAAQSDIGLPNGGHILSLSEKKIVRKTLKRKCRTTSVLSLEDHQQHVGRRWEDTVKFLGAKRICRQLVIHRETTAKRIRRQLGTRRWLFKQSAIGLPDGGHILYLPEKKIVRKTLKRKCRSISVLSLKDHKQHVDWRWEDAAKSHGTKCIRRQLVIHRLSTAKRTHKQYGIHQWPFQRSAIGLPDGGNIPSLLEKKIVRKTLKRKCRSMSVLSLVDCQQHVDRRWEDAAKDIGAKRICWKLVIHRVSISKRICRQHGIHHRWPFERDWATMKGYSLGDERPVEVIRLSTNGKLVSRRRCIYISWLGRFSPWRSALPGGGLIVGPIALSSSEFAGTNNIAQRVGQDQRGSGSSGSENERTREQEDPKEINTNINSNDLRRLLGRMKRADAAKFLGISVSTFKRTCRACGINEWPRVEWKKGAERKKKGRKKDEWRPPDQHGGNNPSLTCRTMATNGLTEMQNEMVGLELNEFFLNFVEGPNGWNTEIGSVAEMSSDWDVFDALVEESTPCQHPMPTILDMMPHLSCSEPALFQQPMPTIPDTMPTVHTMPHLACFEPAPCQQPMPTIPSTMPTIHTMPHLAFSEPAPCQQPMPTIPSTMPTIHTMPHLACSEPAPCQQPMPTIPSTMPTIHPMPHLACSEPAPCQQPMPTIPVTMHHLAAREDMRFVTLKVTYGKEKILRFLFPLMSGIIELKEEVKKRLKLELDSFDIKYEDEEGDRIFLACDEDLRYHLQLFSNQIIRLLVIDSDSNTSNFH